MPTSWVSQLFVAFTFASIITCIPTKPSPKRQSGNGIVTGINSEDENGDSILHFQDRQLTGEAGNSFLRREVRDMKANYPDQWNLYLLALDQLHIVNQEDPFSYYGLAGKLSLWIIG
jgi:tyrosinase